jgi:myo-inositol-1(or 4)-monophosphatase
MQNQVVLINDALREASKFLHRDYFELENLQNSARSIKVFVDKAKTRVADNLQKSLTKYYKTIIFDPTELDLSNLDLTGPIVLVDTLDGTYNFERAIPFFALVVTILTAKQGKISAEKVAINFPVLGEIYYAEQGKGSWFERYSFNFGTGTIRLRVSVNSKLEDSLISCSYQQLQLAQKISTNIRIFESYAYQIALLISGKSEIALLPNKPITYGLDLLVREAGGLSYVKNNVFIASNYQIQEKLQKVLF